MLTKKECWDYHNSLYPYFVRQEDTWMNLAQRGKFAILLSDDKFGRIIALSKYFKSLRYIQKDPMVFGIGKEPTISDPPVEFGLNDCWRWELAYTDSTTLVWRESYDFKDIAELDEAILNVQKVAAIDFVTTRLRRNTRAITRDLHYQEKIYFEKYLQAREILENNIIEAPDGKYQYVSGYANIVNIDLQTAAKNIVFQYDTRTSTTAEYEYSRIKYVKKILEEKDIKNLVPILEAFAAEREY
jgi:hypothetical protein